MKTNRLIIMLCISIAFVNSYAQPFKVMTYNIRYDNPADGDNSWSNRKMGMVNLIVQQNPDLLGMQEVLNGQLEILNKTLKGYEYIGVGRDDGQQAGEYSPLFYRTKRFSIIKSGWFWLSATPDVPGKGWDAACTRICTWALMKDKSTKKDVLVMNTHLDHEGKLARENSLNQLIGFIQQQYSDYMGATSKEERTGLPVLLIGDFNLSPDDPLYQLLKKSNMILREGLTDAYLATATPPFGEAGTFNGFEVDKTPANRIDYVWSAGMEIKSYKSIDQKLPNGRWPSDHLPVVVEAEFTE